MIPRSTPAVLKRGHRPVPGVGPRGDDPPPADVSAGPVALTSLRRAAELGDRHRQPGAQRATRTAIVRNSRLSRQARARQHAHTTATNKLTKPARHDAIHRLSMNASPPAGARGYPEPMSDTGRRSEWVQHAPDNAMDDPGDIERFYDCCSVLMRELLDGLAAAPDQPRSFPEIEDSIGWPRRRIASVLGGVWRLRTTEFSGRRPYRFIDEQESASGRWEMWMDVSQARAVRAASRR